MRKTPVDFKRNPNEWTDHTSAQKPLTLDKMSIYVVALFIAQLFPISVFLLEYFEKKIGHWLSRCSYSYMIMRAKVTPLKIKITLYGVLKFAIMTLLLMEGIIAYWTIYSQFQGFPFGEISALTLITVDVG